FLATLPRALNLGGGREAERLGDAIGGPSSTSHRSRPLAGVSERLPNPLTGGSRGCTVQIRWRRECERTYGQRFAAGRCGGKWSGGSSWRSSGSSLSVR